MSYVKLNEVLIMKSKLSNVISIIFIVISLLLVISNIFELFALIDEYNRLKDLPNTSGVDWLAFSMGLGAILVCSFATVILSIVSFFTGEYKLLKIISAVLFLIGCLSLLAIFIYRLR